VAAAQASEAAAGAVVGVGDGGLDAGVGGWGAEELGAGEVVAGGADADAGKAGDVLDGQAAGSVSFAHHVGSAGLRRVATLCADERVGALVSKLRYAESASRAGVALRGDAAGGRGRPSSGGALVPARRTVPQRSWLSDRGEESLT
jgi:hypothetical protein